MTAHWDSLEQAEYVARDLSKLEGGSWQVTPCEHRHEDEPPAWHVVQTAGDLAGAG